MGRSGCPRITILACAVALQRDITTYKYRNHADSNEHETGGLSPLAGRGTGEETGCQFDYWEVVAFTGPERGKNLVSDAWKRILHLFQGFRRWAESRGLSALLFPPRKPAGPPKLDPSMVLNLRPGDLVRVKSLSEIEATLDERRRMNGLYFMPAMERFAGKTFRVYRRVERIHLETTGQMRRLISPTVFLEGAVCEDCDRACLCFFREAWLQRVPEGGALPEADPGAVRSRSPSPL